MTIAILWVLGIKLGYSGRAASVLVCLLDRVSLYHHDWSRILYVSQAFLELTESWS